MLGGDGRGATEAGVGCGISNECAGVMASKEKRICEIKMQKTKDTDVAMKPVQRTFES